MRGYNDTKLLEEISLGIFERRYTSVDEAAKIVTGEDGGANVDRLRRKYRAEGWFEKGLEMYVQDQIVKRGGQNPAPKEPTTPGDKMLHFARKAARFSWDFVAHILFKFFRLTILRENGKILSLVETMGRGCVLVSPVFILCALIAFFEMIAHQTPEATTSFVNTACQALAVTLSGNALTTQRWWTPEE